MVSLPEIGLSKQEILQTLQSFKQHDISWESGKVFAYVYDPGEEAREVVKEAYGLFLSENGLDPTTYPSLLQLENQTVRIMLNLLRGGSESVGNLTSGGTESIMLAVKTARDMMRAEHQITEPELIVCQTAHPAFAKAAHYLGIKLVVVPFDHANFQVDTDALRAAVTPNTIMVVASAPCYSHGVIDPVQEVAAIAQEHHVLCHIDACVGGLHLSLMRTMDYEVPDFDFSVPGVTSISTDLHKYGYAAKGASVVMYHDKALRKYQFFASTSTTAYVLVNATVQSSKSGGPMAGAWAILHYMGQTGYREIVKTVQDATQKLIDGINQIPQLQVLGQPAMSLMAIGSDVLNVFQLADVMRHRGWLIQPQFSVDGSKPNVHLTVSYGNARLVDEFLADLQTSVDAVSQQETLDPSPIRAQLASLLENPSPETFRQISAMAGIDGGQLPENMALINTILDALPPHAAEGLLIEFFNELYV